MHFLTLIFSFLFLVGLSSYAQFNIPDAKVMQQANQVLTQITLDGKLCFINQKMPKG